MDIQAIHPLPILDFQGPAVYSAAQKAYFSYYGLDFANTTHLFGVRSCAGYDIACHVFIPQQAPHLTQPQTKAVKGTVWLLHGYLDHVGLFRHIIQFLLDEGYAVFGFDLPGHGLSSGESVAIEDFQDYVDVLIELLQQAEQHLPQPWNAIAQSTGGAILMDFLLNHDSSFKQITLLAPLLRAAKWRWVMVQYRLFSRWIDRVPRKFAHNSSDEEFLHFMREREPLQSHTLSVRWIGALKTWIPRFLTYSSKNIEVQLIQGSGDTTVDWKYNLPQIQAKFPRAQLDMLPGARHHLGNECEHYRLKIFSLIRQHWQEPA